ncbi:hypothetical protein NDI76_01485 [Halogeometricum sp. S1BR25-6]|uniref:DUF5667 domain-containing protein n=1 Tax=Halogeometricum salsisoli TaxID=2950536 RepID=A0ABU2G9F9_9EURY|nr:hypothetical protein [Halogeometricum sp. S1BR25-6]MDS0297412.1 hypothetical protein [Halogeometricum sp. S1BR25-6]
MRRSATTAMTAMLLIAALTIVPMAGLAQSDTATPATPTPTADSESTDNESVRSGELLSGVLAVQDAEIDGELETRAFGIRVAQAATDEAKADVVAERLESNRVRLDELERRKARLETARENGSMSRGQYEARIAGLTVETATVKELTNRSANASEGIPSELLERRGVNASAIHTLATRAADLTGPEVAEIARSIAGPNTSRGDASERREAAGNASAPGDRAAAGDSERRGTDADGRRGPAAEADDTTTGDESATTETATSESKSGSHPRDSGTDDSDADREPGGSTRGAAFASISGDDRA